MESHILLRPRGNDTIRERLRISSACSMELDGPYSKEYCKQVRRFITDMYDFYCKNMSTEMQLNKRELDALWQCICDFLNNKTSKFYTAKMVRDIHARRKPNKTNFQKNIDQVTRKLKKK